MADAYCVLMEQADGAVRWAASVPPLVAAGATLLALALACCWRNPPGLSPTDQYAHTHTWQTNIY